MMLRLIGLPGTELMVSPLCLGTNQFGTTIDQAAVEVLLDDFTAMGGNFVDTARVYGDYSDQVPTGPSERAIGTWMASRGRDRLVVATKGGAPDFRNRSFAPRVTPDDLRRDLDESLDHLQTGHVDLYWLHYDDETMPVADILEVMIAEQKAGRIRYFGASNWSPTRIAEAQRHARSIGHPGFAAIQPSWSLAVPNRRAAAAQGYASWFEDGYGELRQSEGFAVIPFGAQGRGFLTRLSRHGEASLPDDLRAHFANTDNARLLPLVEKLASAHRCSVNQIGLAWLMGQPFPVIPIIGPRSPEQLGEAVAATAIHLTPQEIDSLRAFESGDRSEKALP
jgi:aryl-alcohol dehydrogenase-like predicted oxidoreductase